MTEPPVISFDNVSFSYDGEPVLEKVNLSIAPREYIWVVGPNGGGKTTLVKLILGLLRPDEGRVRIFGKAPSAVRSRIGYMPQYSRVDMSFPVTVGEVALMGRLGSRLRVGRYTVADRAAVDKALEQVELLDMRNRPLGALSGGQQRRLMIARALACEPDLLVLDEPMAHLDIRVERELTDLLKQLGERLTVVMVAHDPAFVSGDVKRVVCVKRRVHIHPTSEIDSTFINELYGADLRMVRHDQRQAHNGGKTNG